MAIHSEHAAQDENSPPTSSALRLIAIVVFFTAVYFLASVLVPFLFALVLAIALAPLAGYFQKRGLGRTFASLLCMMLVAGFLVGTAAIIAYQAGTMVQKGDQYVDRLGALSARMVRAVGGDQLLESLTVSGESEQKPAGDAEKGSEAGGDILVAKAKDELRKDAREISRWAMTGLGGVLGGVAGVVLFLAFLFYMLQGRDEWVERLKKTAEGLGMKPRHREFSHVASELGSYLKTLAMVSGTYAVVISLVLWLIGVPQPLLWGVLTALLEVIPFFGPVAAATSLRSRPWEPEMRSGDRRPWSGCFSCSRRSKAT